MRKERMRLGAGLVLMVLLLLLVALVVCNQRWPGVGDTVSHQEDGISGKEDDKGVQDLSFSKEAGEEVTLGSNDLDGLLEPEDVLDSDSTDADRSCPVHLSGAVLTACREDALGKGWTYETHENAAVVGEEVLVELREKGYRLSCATQMDLFGRAWGCVATTGETVVLVHAAPSVVGVAGEGGGPTSVSICSLASEGGM